MIYTSSTEIAKQLDRNKYLICCVLNTVPSDLNCDYHLKSISPPYIMTRSLNNREISLETYLRKYEEYLRNSKDHIADIAELLEKTSSILKKDIVLCGGGTDKNSTRFTLSRVLDDFLINKIIDLKI